MKIVARYLDALFGITTQCNLDKYLLMLLEGAQLITIDKCVLLEH